MHIHVIPNRKSTPTILLRESIREGGKVKKKTVANITHWQPERIEAMQRALKGEFDGIASAETISGKIFGSMFVLKDFADQLGITKALGNKKFSKLSLFLILARIANQGSRLAAVRWAEDHTVAEVLGLDNFDEDDLYEALDWISQEQENIENKLYKQYVKKRGAPPALILYDVTSSYLEGEKNELAKYGYNRDKKEGKKQIVIGLLTASDGEPLSIKVFEGNTSDPETVGDQIQTIHDRFGIKEVVLVGDRGMIKTKGRATLKGNGFKYITALTDPEIRKLIKKGIFQSGLFDEDVTEVEHGGERLVLRRNPATRKKEAYRRKDKLERLVSYVNKRNQLVADSSRAKPEAGLTKYQKWVKQHKLSSFVSLSLKEREVLIEIDEEAKADDALLDGCYVIRSDVFKGMSAQDIHDRYMDLQQVERDFRTMKTGFLEIRPLFVRKAGRTKGHVFITMLALKIVREMRKLLAEKFGTVNVNKDAITLDTSLVAMNRLTLLHSKIGKHTITRLPNPDCRQNKILDALQIKWLGCQLPRKM